MSARAIVVSQWVLQKDCQWKTLLLFTMYRREEIFLDNVQIRKNEATGSSACSSFKIVLCKLCHVIKKCVLARFEPYFFINLQELQPDLCSTRFHNEPVEGQLQENRFNLEISQILFFCHIISALLPKHIKNNQIAAQWTHKSITNTSLVQTH